MFTFQHIEFLLGLVALVPLTLVFLFVLRWKRKARKALGDESLVQHLTGGYSPKLYRLKFIIVAVSIALAIGASANLRKPEPGDKEKKAGIDVIVALDVSKSMWSEDIKPSRLDAAKEFIDELIGRMGDNRLGLVLFAGRAYLQMPLTSDAVASKIFVSDASPDAIPIQGTDIGDALDLCDNSLDVKEKKYKAVVMISDGEDHDPKSEKLIQQLSDDGVVVNTVGVGTKEGSAIMEPGSTEPKKDAAGQTVISKLNEQELQDIAQKTGGTYFHLDDVQATVNSVMQALDGMEKKGIEQGSGEKQYASVYMFFLIPAVLLFAAEIFIPEKKRKAT